MKICPRCKIEKDFSLFGKYSKTIDGYRYICKECRKKETHKFYIKNKEKILLQTKEWQSKNIERTREIKRKYQNNNKDKKYIYARNKRLTDNISRLIGTIRSNINLAIKRNSISKKDKTFNYVGKSGKELMDYLETLFQPGMTRNNQGNGINKWNVDHIKPIASFDKSNSGWLYECYNYRNLQPLWYIDNMCKNSFWEDKYHRRINNG